MFCAAVEETREERIDKDGIMAKDLEMAIQEKHYYHWPLQMVMRMQ